MKEVVSDLSTLEFVYKSFDTRFVSVIGDLAFKRDVFITLGTFTGDVALTLVQDKAKVLYLRENKPDLIPKPADGNPPFGEKYLAVVFNFNYQVDPSFVGDYLKYVRKFKSVDS